MNNEEVSDNRLAYFWQKWLNQHREYNLPNLRMCGSHLSKSKTPGTKEMAFVLYNKEMDASKYGGLAHCHSAWACPKCTAEVMATRAANIACAIDSLKKNYKQTAIMMTFTLPHTSFMTCAETFQILLNSWRKFSRGGNTKYMSKQKYVLKNDAGVRGKKGGALGVDEAGTVKIYNKGINPYGEFRSDLGIIHNVRVFEFTYGENSWHPHIHALFWVPNKNLDKVLDYEQKLLDRWWHCIKTESEKFWTKKLVNDPEKLKHLLETVYPDWKKTPKKNGSQHKSLYISRDKNNPDKVLKAQSSWYICGWGANSEITGKTSHKLKDCQENHLTPYQIISKAFESQGEEREKYLRLYAEYAQATFKHRRCQFSNSGLNKIINEYKQTEEYQKAFKKNVTDKAKKWKVVYWFDKLQWRDLLLIERTTAKYIRADILELARAPNPTQQISWFLEKYYGWDTSPLNPELKEYILNEAKMHYDISDIQTSA